MFYKVKYLEISFESFCIVSLQCMLLLEKTEIQALNRAKIFCIYFATSLFFLYKKCLPVKGKINMQMLYEQNIL